MMQKIVRSGRILHGTVQLPASKSISNRLLLLQFLHPERITVDNHSKAEDTVLLESLLHKVSSHKKAGSSRILGLDVKNSGTVMRFIIGLLSGTPGSYVVSGDKRTAFRPVGILVNALTELGADIQYLETPGYLPLYIKGRNLVSKDIVVDASESSQHISAILLIATAFTGGMNIILKNEPVSRPYIEMTCKIMDKCGFPTVWQEELIRIFPGKRQKLRTSVEPDWSSAAIWYGMMALAEEGEIFFPGLKRTGMQGDEVAVEFFSRLGVQSEETDKGTVISKSLADPGPVEWDFRNCTDLAVPAIVCCAMLGKEAGFSGLENLRIKESDRIQSLQTELAKFNVSLVPDYGGFWRLKPSRTRKVKVRIDSHADHRIAMSMMMAAMKGFEPELADPDVVIKSYPGFWKDMKSMGFEIS